MSRKITAISCYAFPSWKALQDMQALQSLQGTGSCNVLQGIPMTCGALLCLAVCKVLGMHSHDAHPRLPRPHEWQRAWPAHLWGAACEAHLVPAIPCKLEGLVSFKSFARPCKLQCLAKGLPVTFKTQPGIAVHKVLQVQPCGLTGLARTCKLQGGAKSFYDFEGIARPCKLQCVACTPCYLQDLLSGTVA